VTEPAQSQERSNPSPDGVERYLRYLTTERRLSPRTAAAYRDDIRILSAHAGDTPLVQLSAHDIRRIVSTQHGRGLSGRSIARMLSAWRGLFRFLAREQLCAHDPCAGVRAPRSPKRLPAALSPDEARRLVEVDGDDMFAVRDRAMLELLYSSGLRVSELAALDWSMLDSAQESVRVLGKGSKTRVVPVGRPALAMLHAWRERRRELERDDAAAVFVSRAGRRLSARSIQRQVRRAGLRQGIAGRVHPHVLRHSFASHVLQSSGDLRAVQEMLGHASIATTQVYTHLDFQHLAKVYDAAHPRARKKRTPKRVSAK
jgi:integrase/recombinase XerC